MSYIYLFNLNLCMLITLFGQHKPKLFTFHYCNYSGNAHCTVLPSMRSQQTGRQEVIIFSYQSLTVTGRLVLDLASFDFSFVSHKVNFYLLRKRKLPFFAVWLTASQLVGEGSWGFKKNWGWWGRGTGWLKWRFILVSSAYEEADKRGVAGKLWGPVSLSLKVRPICHQIQIWILQLVQTWHTGPYYFFSVFSTCHF